MEKRDKEIKKLMAEKGFDSFDDLSERLNQFPTTDSYEDVVAELAELKMQLINPESLFTLTAEEVEIAEKLFIVAKQCGSVISKDDINEGNAEDVLMGLSIVSNADNLLDRIKKWKDENKNLF